MAGKFDFGQAITSLAMAIRDQPRSMKEPPIAMVKDPLTEKAIAYCKRIDATLTGLDCRIADMPSDVRRLAWRRQCKKATMDGNKRELEALLAWYYLWREVEKGNEEVKGELGKFFER